MNVSDFEDAGNGRPIEPATLLDHREEEVAQKALARRVEEVLAQEPPALVAAFMQSTFMKTRRPSSAEDARFHTQCCRSMLHPQNWSDGEIRFDFQNTCGDSIALERARLVRLLSIVSRN